MQDATQGELRERIAGWRERIWQKYAAREEGEQALADIQLLDDIDAALAAPVAVPGEELRVLVREAADAEDAASAVLGGLCSGTHRFTMSVPVQQTDTDIVIGNALALLRRICAALSNEVKP